MARPAEHDFFLPAGMCLITFFFEGNVLDYIRCAADALPIWAVWTTYHLTFTTASLIDLVYIYVVARSGL